MICLDAIWQPDWDKDNVPEFRALMAELHATDQWISDGNFAAATFDIRMPRVTLVVWLERSKLSCSARAVRRVFTKGEPHRIRNLFKVLAFIWRFDRINRPIIEEKRMMHGPEVPVLHLHSDQEISDFVESRFLV